jgi:hypothetical protein
MADQSCGRACGVNTYGSHARRAHQRSAQDARLHTIRPSEGLDPHPRCPMNPSESGCWKIISRCPRANRCSVPMCPLDPRQSERVCLEGEERCTIGKKARIRAAEGSNLPLGGRTPSEASGEARWNAMPEDQKLAAKSRVRAMLVKYHRDLREGQPDEGKGT